MCLMLLFFFKQKTAYEMRISDWSSDVCSSDLEAAEKPGQQLHDSRLVAEASELEACRIERHRPGTLLVNQCEQRRQIALPEQFARPEHKRLVLRDRHINILQHQRASRPPSIGRSDRKSVVEGKRVSVRVDPGCSRHLKNK